MVGSFVRQIVGEIIFDREWIGDERQWNRWN